MSGPAAMGDSVTVHVAAPPARVWELVSDITNIGRFSPETFEAEWLDGATGPAVGTRFRGHVRRNGRGPVYWTICTIIVCERGREFAFAVGGRRIGHVNTWRYQFEPSGDGTVVTESFQLPHRLGARLYWKFAGRARRRFNVNAMRETLERVKAVAEAPGSESFRSLG
ncbi:MAG: SRPBCC family protein [Pseudonocardiaceae bacterium]